MRVVIGAACLVAALVIGLFMMLRDHGEPVHPRDAAVAAVPADAAAQVASPPPPPAADAALAVAEDAAPPALDDAANAVFEAFEALRNSGPANEPWDATAEQLFKSLPEMSEMGCYVAGCGVSLELSSAAMFDRRRTEIEAMPAYRAWTGGKKWTVPVASPSGGVVVALILYRPD